MGDPFFFFFLRTHRTSIYKCIFFPNLYKLCLKHLREERRTYEEDTVNLHINKRILILPSSSHGSCLKN